MSSYRPHLPSLAHEGFSVDLSVAYCVYSANELLSQMTQFRYIQDPERRLVITRLSKQGIVCVGKQHLVSERMGHMTDGKPRPAGGPSRRALLRNGLLVGGAAATGIASPVLTGVARADSYTWQPHWTWCYDCQVLYYGHNQAQSVCPSGGTHVGYGTTSGNYELQMDYLPVTSNPQQKWAWCLQCQGLFYGPYQGSSYCPAAGPGNLSTHNGSASGNYALHLNYNNLGFQPNWVWCNKCMGMWYTQGPDNNVCPKDLYPHTHVGSGAYWIFDSNYG